MSSDHAKCRTLKLAQPQQAAAAASLLSQQAGLRTRADPACGEITLLYSLHEYTLLDILHCLEQAGITLDRNPVQRVHCQLACYCEQLQRENLQCPPPATKGQEAFARLYQRHPHGDHDDTPPELRLEK